MVGRWAAGLVLGLFFAAGVVPSSPAVATSPHGETSTPSPAADEVDLVKEYIEQVYLDLFGRLPDPSGLDAWTRALGGGTWRGSVAVAITSSDEFRSRLIADAYDSYLGRRPDDGGRRYWLARMAEGRTIAEIGSGFVASDEYWSRAGGTPAGWVRALYRDVLDRAARADEVAYWVTQLNGGAARAAVALGFLLSTEKLATVVDGYYRWLLGRGLDGAGRASWVGMLQSGHRDEEIIAGIIASDEYWSLAYSASDIMVGVVGEAAAGAPFRVTVLSAITLADLTAQATLALDGDPGPCRARSCTTTVAGEHTLTATIGANTAAATFFVQPGPATTMTLSPEALTIADGGSVEYTVVIEDSWQNSIPTESVRLSAGGASCAGLTCGPLGQGTYEVRASFQGLTETASLTVSPPGPPSHSLVTWGRLPSGERAALPQPFGTRSDWASVTNNYATYLAIRSDGTLWGWGSNSCGAVAGSELYDVAEPAQIGRSRWVDAEAGGLVAAGIQPDGSLWLWADRGCSYHSAVSAPLPVRVGTGHWVDVSAGFDHVLAVRADGTLWSFGGNQFGQLGTGTAAAAPRTREPAQVGTDSDWGHVSASMFGSFAIKSDGTLWGWGRNVEGRLGIGTTANVSVPTQVGDASDWVAVSSGSELTTGIREDGSLWTWGKAAVTGAGGVEPRPPLLTPTQIGQGRVWTAVSAGYGGTVAVDSDGTAWSWGTNENGRLGDGTTVPREDPAPIVDSGGWSTAVLDMSSGVALVPAVP